MKNKPQSIQHELFPFDTGMSKELLADILENSAPRKVHLAITDNRVSMVSVDFSKPQAIKVRLHEAFLKAPEDVINALKRFLHDGNKSDWGVISTFAKRIVSENMRPARRKKKPKAGLVHHLGEIRNNVNKCFFGGKVSCDIEWGQRVVAKKRGRKSRSIRYGSWIPDLKTIRINPLLDDERVPYEFIRYIVFHEMLHAVVPVEQRGSRNYYHATTFKRLERAFPNLDVMHDLAKELITILK